MFSVQKICGILFTGNEGRFVCAACAPRVLPVECAAVGVTRASPGQMSPAEPSGPRIPWTGTYDFLFTQRHWLLTCYLPWHPPLTLVFWTVQPGHYYCAQIISVALRVGSCFPSDHCHDGFSSTKKTPLVNESQWCETTNRGRFNRVCRGRRLGEPRDYELWGGSLGWANRAIMSFGAARCAMSGNLGHAATPP
jgi:hypothetical protein